MHVLCFAVLLFCAYKIYGYVSENRRSAELNKGIEMISSRARRRTRRYR